MAYCGYISFRLYHSLWVKHKSVILWVLKFLDFQILDNVFWIHLKFYDHFNIWVLELADRLTKEIHCSTKNHDTTLVIKLSQLNYTY